MISNHSQNDLVISIPSAQTAEGEAVRNEYIQRLNNRLDDYRRLPLNVLVWGPGATSDTLARKKRVDIKNELKNRGHNAMFSEEIEQYGRDLPLTVREKAQVETADMVIVMLEDAPGALVEVYRFATQYHLGKKFCILIPRKYDGGFPGQDIQQVLNIQVQSVFWYTEEELKRCDVLTEALKQVRIMQNQIAVNGEHG